MSLLWGEIMQITINKKELKKISLNLRITASRLLNTEFREGIDNLKRFLNFIKDTPIIYDFILRSNVKKFNIKEIIQSKEYNEKFSIPCEVKEEITFVYQLLDYEANNYEDYEFLAMGYSFGTKYQDHVDAFNKDVVNPFVNHIISYLEELMIDMGMDEKSTMSINFNGENSGQINLGQGNSTINAVYNNNNNNAESIKELTVALLDLLKAEELPKEEKEEIKEVIETVNEEVTSQKPKKSILKFCLSKLMESTKLVKEGTELFITLWELINILKPFLK